jgi:hypothetical protein
MCPMGSVRKRHGMSLGVGVRYAGAVVAVMGSGRRGQRAMRCGNQSLRWQAGALRSAAGQQSRAPGTATAARCGVFRSCATG